MKSKNAPKKNNEAAGNSKNLILILAGAALFILASGLIISLAIGQPKGRTKENFQRTALKINKPASSSPALSNKNTSSSLTINQAIGAAPAEWGTVVKITYLDEKEYGRDIYLIDFANSVSAAFQSGESLFAYNKIIKPVSCSEKNLGSSREQADPRNSVINKCIVLEKGIYNLKTNKNFVFESSAVNAEKSQIQPAPFSYLDKNGAIKKAIFTPQGKYYAQIINDSEGCSMAFVNFSSKKAADVLPDGQAIEETEFSCDPLLNFSSDGQIFAVRAAHADMNSPEVKFSVIQGDKQWTVLPKILIKEIETAGDEINLSDDIKILSINSRELKFDILNDTEYYKKGNYIFNLEADKVIKN